jgi:hypothetical protein
MKVYLRFVRNTMEVADETVYDGEGINLVFLREAIRTRFRALGVDVSPLCAVYVETRDGDYYVVGSIWRLLDAMDHLERESYALVRAEWDGFDMVASVLGNVEDLYRSPALSVH